MNQADELSVPSAGNIAETTVRVAPVWERGMEAVVVEGPSKMRYWPWSVFLKVSG